MDAGGCGGADYIALQHHDLDADSASAGEEVPRDSSMRGAPDRQVPPLQITFEAGLKGVLRTLLYGFSSPMRTHFR